MGCPPCHQSLLSVVQSKRSRSREGVVSCKEFQLGHDLNRPSQQHRTCLQDSLLVATWVLHLSMLCPAIFHLRVAGWVQKGSLPSPQLRTHQRVSTVYP